MTFYSSPKTIREKLMEGTIMEFSFMTFEGTIL